MFSITDNERLRDAYALLMFMQSDIPASAEKRAAVKNLAATVKMEIRAYNNRPAPDVHIICADYDGRLELVQLPDKLDEAHEMDATNWFLNHRYLRSYNSPYDCTGQEFTNWFYLPRQLLGFCLCDFGLAGLERGLSLGLDPLNLLGLLRFFLGQPAAGDAADVGLHGIRQDELAPAGGHEHTILCQLLHPAACNA